MKLEPSRRIFAALAMATALGVLLGACGVKGPLYLPEEQETEEAEEKAEEKEKAEDENKTSRRLPVPERAMHG